MARRRRRGRVARAIRRGTTRGQRFRFLRGTGLGRLIRPFAKMIGI